MAAGVGEVTVGHGISVGSYGSASPIGLAVAAHGADQFCVGFRKFVNGRDSDTATSQIMQTTGMSKNTANTTDNFISILGTAGGPAAMGLSIPKLGLPPIAGNVALSRGAEGHNARAALNCKLSQLESFQQNAVRIKTLPDGRIRYYTEVIPSKNMDPTYGACRVLEWNPLKGCTRAWHECCDHFGNVNRVHPKSISGQYVKSQHYPLTAKEL